jgi:hypothetical protein
MGFHKKDTWFTEQLPTIHGMHAGSPEKFAGCHGISFYKAFAFQSVFFLDRGLSYKQYLGAWISVRYPVLFYN